MLLRFCHLSLAIVLAVADELPRFVASTSHKARRRSKWQVADSRRQAAGGSRLGAEATLALALALATAASDCEAKSNRRAHKSQTAAVLLEFTLRLIVNGIMMESHKVVEEGRESEGEAAERGRERQQRVVERQSGPAKGSSLAKLL